jgi:hypothetical protein
MRNGPSDKPARDPPSADDDAHRESGEPGGAGRRDEVQPIGVYSTSAGIPDGHHPEILTQAAWGQGERGAVNFARPSLRRMPAYG